MTKKKLHEEILRLCEEHQAPEALTKALDELTAPKKAGSAANVNDYTCFDEDGDVEYIFCRTHKKWEPVVAEDEEGNVVELFKKDKNSKNGYARECNVAIEQWRTRNKTFNATKQAVLDDLINGVIDGEKAKELLAEAEAIKNERQPRPDGIGLDEKPCGEVEDEE